MPMLNTRNISVTINLSHPAQGLKESGNGPGLSVDSGAHAIRQDTGQILSNAPARDVGNALNGKFPQERENLFRVDSRRREEDFTERPVQFRQRGLKIATWPCRKRPGVPVSSRCYADQKTPSRAPHRRA